MTDLDALLAQAPKVETLLRSMPMSSAQQHYCARYLAHRLTGCERPAASGWAIGVDHAAELRKLVEERLPEDLRDLSRA